jgi:glycosyltransferase involved in cell wall biosynthesis
VRVLRNGVDLDYFQPGDSTKRESNTVVLSGKMSYHANVAMATHFVREIMPPVWAARPDVKVLIVGKDPVREVQALGEHPGVTVTGTVEDIRPYLQRAAIAAAPVQYGVGIQNKVLEAMASAAPVIAAPQAISALNVVPGRDVQVAGEPSIFAQALLNLLNDPGQRERLGSAGRTYVEENHDWRVVAGKLEEVYQQAVIARQSNLMN